MRNETRPVILTAGRATRAGSLAPDGCKALVRLDDRPIIEWQLDCFTQEPVIVARSEHAEMLVGYGDVVVNDRCLGAGDALRSALKIIDDEPITVVYADTFFTDIPDGSDWVGIGTGWGGRAWDIVYDYDGDVRVSYTEATGETTVCVGLYSFADVKRLRDVVPYWAGYHSKAVPSEWGLSWVVNDYPGLRWEPVPSWIDCGSVDDIQRWRHYAA